MRRALLVAIVVIVVALVALAWQAPAAWLGERMAAASGNAVVLANAEGTVWSGRGVIASGDGRWRIPVGWHVVPSALLHGELAFAFDPLASDVAPRGTIRLHTHGIAVDGLALRLPAAALETALRSRAPLVLGGDIVVDVPTLVAAGDARSGGMNLRWNQASIAAPGMDAVALGAVTATLVARGSVFAGPIANAGGDVRIAGQVEVQDRGGAVDVTLTPLPSASPAVARALAALGPPAADGSVRYTWRGNLR